MLCGRWWLKNVVGWASTIFLLVGMGADHAEASQSVQRETNCSDLLDSLHQEYLKGDLNYLIRDFGSQSCTSDQKQDALYHQALGNLILGRIPDGILYLKAALDYSGAFRELAWYELWRAASQLGDRELAQEAMLGIYREFPASKFLFEVLSIETQQSHVTKSKRTIRSKPWSIGTQHLLSSTTEPGYARTYLDNRIQGSWSWVFGKHHLNPGVQMSAIHDFDVDSNLTFSKRLEFSTVATEVSLGYLNQWVFGSVSTGLRYDFLRREYASLAELGLPISFLGWNYPQLGASLGCRIPQSSLLSYTVYASANRFSQEFQSVSLNGSVALEQNAFTHQMNLSLERMFLDMQLSSMDSGTHLEALPGATSTEVTRLTGLWADEFSYSIDYPATAWDGQMTVSFREERGVLEKGQDTILIVADSDGSLTGILYGDTPSTERKASVEGDFKWKFSSRLQLKAALRWGYLWTTTSLPEAEKQGFLYRVALSLTTRF